MHRTTVGVGVQPRRGGQAFQCLKDARHRLWRFKTTHIKLNIGGRAATAAASGGRLGGWGLRGHTRLVSIAKEKHLPIALTDRLCAVREPLLTEHGVERHGLEGRKQPQRFACLQAGHGAHDAGTRLTTGADVGADVQSYDFVVHDAATLAGMRWLSFDTNQIGLEKPTQTWLANAPGLQPTLANE